MAVAHFAERYGLFVIICLGESIVAIGPGRRRHPIDARLVAAVALGLSMTVGLWWTYFDRFADIAEARLRTHDDVVLAAADSYSYLHLVIVAGIIVFAVGMKVAIGDVGDVLRRPRDSRSAAGSRSTSPETRCSAFGDRTAELARVGGTFGCSSSPRSQATDARSGDLLAAAGSGVALSSLEGSRRPLRPPARDEPLDTEDSGS